MLVKGADYTREGVVGGDLVESWGGEVKLATFTDGFSDQHHRENDEGRPVTSASQNGGRRMIVVTGGAGFIGSNVVARLELMLEMPQILEAFI